MKSIIDIYNEFVGTDECFALGNIELVENSQTQLDDMISSLLKRDAAAGLDGYIGDYAMAKEMQGFIWGFALCSRYNAAVQEAISYIKQTKTCGNN